MGQEELNTITQKGSEYHDLLARFMTEHPEVKDVLNAEEDYIAFTMLKSAYKNIMFGVMLDLPGMMESFKETLCACFIQGYYRAYQKLRLDKM